MLACYDAMLDAQNRRRMPWLCVLRLIIWLNSWIGEAGNGVDRGMRVAAAMAPPAPATGRVIRACSRNTYAISRESTAEA